MIKALTTACSINLDDFELQWRLLYSIFVANKTSEFAEKKTLAFIGMLNKDELPFDYIKTLDDFWLDNTLRFIGVGQYRRTVPALRGIVNLNLRTCTIDDLEAVKGIGMKTSRFYLMCIKRDSDVATLDVHVLRWMKSQGYDVPTLSEEDQLRLFLRVNTTGTPIDKAHLEAVRERLADISGSNNV